MSSTNKKISFIVLFCILGIAALQVPITRLAGSKSTFTLFDLFGPIATAFIGTTAGVISVFFMQFANFLIHGAKVVDAGTIIRFFPMLFAAWYFGKKHPLQLIVPIAAIIAFTTHPIGKDVWYFSLYWLIPIFCYFIRSHSIVARSLGATFTAHAVGGALWIYAFNLPRTVWDALIPVVAIERLVFALGIAGAYIIFNNILNYVAQKRVPQLKFMVDERYLVVK